MVVAVSQCSGCGSQTFEDDSYCQECGKFLRSEAAETKAPKLALSLIEQDTGDFLANLNPGSAKPVVSLPVVAGAVVFLLLIPCGIYAVEHSYDSISTSYICDQAKKAVEEGRPEAAIEQLDRLAMTHHGLPGPAKNILDSALLEETNRLIITGDYQHARNDLKRISSEFANTKAVYQRLQVCDHHLALQSADSAKTSDSHTSRRPAKHSKQSISERHQSPGTTSSAVSVSPTVATTAAKVSPTVTTTAAKVSPTVTTTAAKVSPTVPTTAAKVSPSVTSTDTNVSAEAPAADSKVATTSSTTSVAAQTSTGAQPAQAAVKPKKSKVAAANFSQNDVARYNALLAGYFSCRGGANGELREPLSFREWVEKGKPKF